MSNENENWEDEQDAADAADIAEAKAAAEAAAQDTAGGGRRARRRAAQAEQTGSVDQRPSPVTNGGNPAGHDPAAVQTARDKLLEIGSRFGWTADDNHTLFGHSGVRFTLGDLRAIVGLNRPGA